MEVLQRTANRGSISTGGYEIDNSLKLEADNSERLKSNNTHAATTATSIKTGTFSFWVKRTELGANYMVVSGDSARYSRMFFNSDDKIQLYSGDTSWNSVQPITNAVFRDTSAWYHIVLRLDSTDGTAANRLRLYVNSEEQTWGTSPNITQDGVHTLCAFGSPTFHSWGSNLSYFSPSAYFSGYLAEVHYVDGQALAPTEFGEVDDDSGIWKPKAYGGTYGNCGYYLDFEDSGNLGDDESGNGFDFDENNIAAADQATDTPTNNFCTLNPIVNFKYTTNGITEGGTEFGDNTGGGHGGAFGTMAVTSGKWYWEMKLVQQVSHYIGVSAVDDGDNVLASSDPHELNSTFRFNISAARREYVNNGSQTYGSLDEFSDFHTAGDIIGIALNMDDNQISIYGNGTLQTGVANTSLFDAANKMVVPFHGTINDEVQYNFGGYSAWTPSSAASDENGYGTFEYAPPTGYYALCTKNLAEYG